MPTRRSATRGRVRLGRAGLAASALLASAACSLTFDPDDLTAGGPPGGAGGAAPVRGAGGAPDGAGGGAAGAPAAGGGGGAAGGQGGAAGAGGGAPSPCGNGALDPGEECDDGPRNGVDSACSARCDVRCDAGLFFGAAFAAKDPATGHCYALVTFARPFDDAAAACATGASVASFRLASPRTAAELDFVRAALPLDLSTWVGLRDDDPGDELAAFGWVDGSPGGPVGPDSPLWGATEPDDLGDTDQVEDGEEECVALGDNREYFFADVTCGSDLPYICEYSPAPL